MKRVLWIAFLSLAPGIAGAHEGHGGLQGHFHAFGIEHWLGLALAAALLAWIASRGR
jgi:hypothetical protein